MDSFLDLLPWLIAMALLMACSGFFSASEAALFYLPPRDRRAMASGSRCGTDCHCFASRRGQIVVSDSVLEPGHQRHVFRDFLDLLNLDKGQHCLGSDGSNDFRDPFIAIDHLFQRNASEKRWGNDPETPLANG